MTLEFPHLMNVLASSCSQLKLVPYLEGVMAALLNRFSSLLSAFASHGHVFASDLILK